MSVLVVYSNDKDNAFLRRCGEVLKTFYAEDDRAARIGAAAVGGNVVEMFTVSNEQTTTTTRHRSGYSFKEDARVTQKQVSAAIVYRVPEDCLADLRK